MFEIIIEFLQKIGLIFDPVGSIDFASYGEPFYVSFEGLNIGQFRLDPVAIPIGNGIRWYGIIIVVAIILAFTYVSKRATDIGYKFDDLLDFVLIVVPCGVLGARLYEVFMGEGYDWTNWYRIWDGGLAIYGAIIAGALAILGVGLYKKVRILRLMDCTAPAVMIAQAIGRWGNFFNGEVFGRETGSLLRMGLSNVAGGEQIYVHPTFLYESLWNILGFVLINIFFKKKKFDGQIVLEYFAWYGFGRFFIENLRDGGLPIHLFGYDFRASSVLALVSFLIAAVLFVIFIIRKPSPALALPCYYRTAKAEVVTNTDTVSAEAETAEKSNVTDNTVDTDAPNGNSERNNESEQQ